MLIFLQNPFLQVFPEFSNTQCLYLFYFQHHRFSCPGFSYVQVKFLVHFQNNLYICVTVIFWNNKKLLTFSFMIFNGRKIFSKTHVFISAPRIFILHFTLDTYQRIIISYDAKKRKDTHCKFIILICGSDFISSFH